MTTRFKLRQKVLVILPLKEKSGTPIQGMSGIVHQYMGLAANRYQVEVTDEAFAPEYNQGSRIVYLAPDEMVAVP